MFFFVHFKDLSCIICLLEPDCWMIKGREIGYTKITKKMEKVTATALPVYSTRVRDMHFSSKHYLCAQTI